VSPHDCAEVITTSGFELRHGYMFALCFQKCAKSFTFRFHLNIKVSHYVETEKSCKSHQQFNIIVGSLLIIMTLFSLLTVEPIFV